MSGAIMLTARDAEVLGDLRRWRGNDGWARPMDVGGRDASHHGHTLAKLCRLGFAEKKTRGSNRSFRYRAVGWKK